MLLRHPLNPALTIIDRFSADVDVTEDDDITALGYQSRNAGGKSVKVIHLVRKP